MASFAISPEEYLVRAHAEESGVDPDLMVRVAQAESGMSPSALSRKGALGIMQLMPSTAEEMGVDRSDAADNIKGGVQYFKKLLDRYGGDERKAAAAYNAGPRRVDSGEPLPKETQDYVAKVAPKEAALTVSPEDFLNEPNQPKLNVSPEDFLAATQSAPPASAQVPGLERLGGVPPSAGTPPRPPEALRSQAPAPLSPGAVSVAPSLSPEEEWNYAAAVRRAKASGQPIPPKPEPHGPQILAEEPSPKPVGPAFVTPFKVPAGSMPSKKSQEAGPEVWAENLTNAVRQGNAKEALFDLFKSPVDLKAVDDQLGNFLVGPFAIQKGVIEGAVAAGTSPGNLLIGAGISGAAKLAEGALSPAIRASWEAADAALSAYFAGTTAVGAAQQGKAAWDAIQKGNYEEAATDLGMGSVDALFAYIGGKNAIQKGLDIKTGIEQGIAIGKVKAALQDELYRREEQRKAEERAASQPARITQGEEPAPGPITPRPVLPSGQPEAGSTYELPGDRKYTVLSRADGKTRFEAQTPNGTFEGTLADDKFSAMVAKAVRPQGAPSEQTAAGSEQGGQPGEIQAGGEGGRVGGAVQEGQPAGTVPGTGAEPGGSSVRESQSSAGDQSAQAGAVKTPQTEDIITGEVDKRLTDEGKEDAAKVAKATTNVDSIETTPKSRGQETADLAADESKKGVQPEAKPYLGPWNLGDFQGQRHSEVSDQINDYIANKPNDPVPGGESFNDFRSRLIGGVLQDSENWKPGDRFLRITHSIGIHTIQAWAKNGAPKDGSISIPAILNRQHMEPNALWRLDPRTNKFTEVDNTKQDGIFYERHADTEWDNLSPEEHSYSSTQVQLPAKVAQAARVGAEGIPEHELAEDGRETDPHVTVLWGLHGNEPAAVKKALADEGPITAKVGPVSIFPGKEHDVVKLDIESPDLHRLNGKLKSLPHTSTFPDYHPHITLAYVRSGEGQKYVGKQVPGLTGQTITFGSVRHSGKDGTTTDIPLKGAATSASAPSNEGEKGVVTAGGAVAANGTSNISTEQGNPAETLTYRKGPDKIDVRLFHDPARGWQAEGDFNLQGQAGGDLGNSGLETWHPTREDALKTFLNAALRNGNALTAEIGGEQSDKVRARQSKMMEWLSDLRAATPSGALAPTPTKKPITPQIVPTSRHKEGDRVAWGRGGKQFTGTIRNIYKSDGTASIDTDQIAVVGGGIPIGRIETVPLTELTPITSAPKTDGEPSIAGRVRKEWAAEPDWYQDIKGDRPPWSDVVEAYAKFRGDHPTGYSQHIKDFAVDFVGGTGDAQWYRSKPPLAPASQEPTIRTGNEPAGSQPVRPADSEPLAEQLPEGGQPAGEGQSAPTSSPASRRSRKPRGGASASERPELEPGAGTVSGVVGNPAEPEQTFPPRAQDVVSTHHDRDYRIPDGRVISGSPETRARNNIASIRTLRHIQSENRPATVEEQEILAGYVGWGAVPQLFAGSTPEFQALQKEFRDLVSEQEYSDAERSTTNAHYTGDTIVDAIWQALKKLGAKAGMSWLEPAFGIGNFFGRQPQELLEGARRIGLDKDSLSGQIAKLLYPDSGIDIVAFEESELPGDYFDAAVSNVPFGNFGVHDPEFRGKDFLTSSIHNYFFAKAMTRVRPGGVVAFITSRYTMDGYDKPIVDFRKWMAQQAHLIGAVRLPSGTFRQNAGTDVITDVIFLRKKLPDEAQKGEVWLDSNRKSVRSQQGYQTPVSVNEYYSAHPENILGLETTARGQFTANDYDVKGAASQSQIVAAFEKFPKIGFEPWSPVAPRKTVAVRSSESAKGAKLGGFFFDENGKLMRRTSKGSAEPVDASTATAKKIRGQLEIRNALVRLHAAELADKPDTELAALRKNLNAVYDTYVKANGPLSSQSNIAMMKGDPDAPLLVTLERRFEKGNKSLGREAKAEKGPIFERRMLRPPKTPTTVADAKEALSITLNDRGRVDFERMGELTGKTPGELQKDLAGIIFQDPKTKIWQTAEDYLSGSVRTKLKEARGFAKVEPQYQPNAEALEKVQPEDIPPGEISALLGVTWVPLDVYSEFAKDLLGAEGDVAVKYAGGNWVVNTGYNRLANAPKWSTARVPAARLLEDSLNSARTKVVDVDRDGKATTNPDETKSARAKQMEMQAYFEQWLFADPKRADPLARIYNDTNNDLRLRTYDGSHLTLPGMTRNAAVVRGGDLDPHQKAAVWRQIVQPNVLLGHAVGSGKTFEMIAAGMELKRLGLIRRPMYVVPNATLTGWQQQFTALYPQARVLVFSEKDLEKSKRREAMAQIATGDWDAAVVPHSSFQFLPTGDDIFNEHFEKLKAELEEAIEESKEAGVDTRRIKRMEKAKERLLTSLKDRRAADKKDQTVTWEQMGIDQLFVDESHEYKKLGFATKQGNVAGIDQNGNQKTFDLMMKMRYTQKHGRGVVFATGTPVTNTMGELYSAMKYLIEPELEARGLGKFDEWAANYGRTVDVFEPKVEGGGYQMKARFAEFVNLPELSQLLRSFADIVTSDMLNLPRPKLAGGQREAVETQLTPGQSKFLESLRHRAAHIRADPRGSLPDNMLAVYTDAAKMALDLRMVEPWAEDDPLGRLNTAADRIATYWKASEAVRGTQLVMSDMGKPEEGKNARGFSLYEDLINKLVARGIPREQIATVYQAKNKAQRARLFQDVNDGKIRVLMGSTMKLGVGTNVQERLFALHHLDVPHRPSDLEQREGRILRQGNINPEVHVPYYITKGSLDEAKFANVVRKAKFINQVMQGKSTVRKAEDVGGMIPSLEMFQAMASGDPRVMRKMEVDAEVDRLSGVYSGWKSQQFRIRQDLSGIPSRISRAERNIEVLQRDMATRDAAGDVWRAGKSNFSGEKLSKPFNEALSKEVLKVANQKNENVEIGTAWGLPLVASFKGAGGYAYVRIEIGDGSDVDIQAGELENLASVDFHRRIANKLKGLEEGVTFQQGLIDSAKKDEKNLKNSVEEHWPYAQKFADMVAEQQQLVKDLGATKGDDAAVAAGDGAEIADASVEAEEPDGPEAEDEEEDGPIDTFLKGESGTIDLSRMGEILRGQFGDDADRVSYSGIGAAERILLPGKQLSEVRRANKPVFRAAIRAAGSESTASTIIRSAVAAIRKSLIGSDHTWEEIQLYYVESRLRGLRERWMGLAKGAEKSSDDELQQAVGSTSDGQPSPLLSLLSYIEGRQGLDQDLGQSAAAIAEAKDWPTLRKFLSQTFRDASDRVATAMEPEWFDTVHEAVQDNPKVSEADRLYGELMENPMAEIHAINEGVFSNALGPAGRYYPLIPTTRPQVMPEGRRLPYRKPRNLANAFATGLSESYDVSMDAFAKRLSAAVRGNNKAALVKTLEDEGWALPESRAFRNEDGKLMMTGPDGEEYIADREETSAGRTLVKDGKAIRIPARFIVMPRFVNRALAPILAREAMDDNELFALARTANMLATKGPSELMFHMNGVMGALYANTPFLGTSGLDAVMSAPIAKWFWIRKRIYGDAIAGKIGLYKDPLDPADPENVKKLLDLSKAGALPSRSGKVTYSRQIAKETGAKREMSFAPLLYGPHGLDARARILMYDIWKEAYPSGSIESLHDFVNQIGNYIPELQSEMERLIKKTGLGPFATAGMTRVVNSIHNYTGTGPGPGETWKSKLSWWLTSSAVLAIGLWAIAYRELTGQWPTKDARAKFGYFPVGGGNGPLDKFRHTPIGNALWGTGNRVGYISAMFFDNPLTMRGARALGIRGAAETLHAGGTAGQASEAATTDALNALASPALGPAARAAFVGLTSEEPYVTGLRDYRTGKVGMSFLPAIPAKSKPGLQTYGRRALAAAKQLNSFWTEAAENTGSLTGLYNADEEKPQGAGSWWARGLLDLAAPGLFANASNPYAKRRAIQSQQRAVGR